MNSTLNDSGVFYSITNGWILTKTNDYKLPTSTAIEELKIIYESEHINNLINGFTLGILLALMIYNLYTYIAIKEKLCLYFLGYLLFCVVFLMVYNGSINDWFPDSHLKLLISAGALVLISSIQFANAYLYVADYSPKLFKIHILLIITFLIPIIIDWIGYHILAFQLLQICLTIAIFYWLAAAYFSWKKASKPSIYYLLGLVSLLAGYLFYKESQLIVSLQIGLSTQALILSIILADKLNTLKKETLLLREIKTAKTADFSKQLIQGQENEKENIANELNALIGQQLVLLKNQLYLLKKRNKNDSQNLYNEITEDIGKAIEDVGSISSSLRPHQMNILGLKHTIKNLVENINDNSEVTIELNLDETDKVLNRFVETHLYRVIQELLNNLIKHAMASHCSIHIKIKKDYLKFYYRDNGKGFNPKQQLVGLGLSSIKERCSLLSAYFHLSSKEGLGTKVYIKIPLNTDKTNQYTINNQGVNVL